jgi:gliding motility-associated protein GldM
MGLPKEPRQKMINLMYLVLTALLALNVSSEILNAFKTVNNSIVKSNTVIDDKNKMIYESLAEKLKDPQTAAKAAIWAPKAEAVKNLAADVSSYIDNLKLELKQESGLRLNDKGEEEFKEDNLDAPIRMMGEKGEGEKLYNKLKSFKEQALAVLKPEEFADNPTLQAEIKKAKADFEKSLPINLNVPESKSGNSRTGDDVKDWTNSYFHMTPTIASLTILSKFQNDVKNSEAQLVDYCHNQIGKVKLVYDQFQAIAQSSASYAMPGDNLEITAGVGAFSAAAKPKIYIGGQLQSLTSDGTAVYKTTASGSGEHVVDVKIEYTKPDGSVTTVNKPVKYTVGVPSGASVFLE